MALPASRATTRIVSSPAMVPTTSGSPARSNALARNCAAPGGVRSTTRLPLASAPVSSSRSSRRSRSGACSADRSGPCPSSGMTYDGGRAVGAPHLDRAQLLQVARERGLGGRQALRREQLAQLALRPHRALADQRDDPRVPGGLRDRLGHHGPPGPVARAARPAAPSARAAGSPPGRRRRWPARPSPRR